MKKLASSCCIILLVILLLMTLVFGFSDNESPEHKCSGENCVVCLTSLFDGRSAVVFATIISTLSIFVLAVAAYCLTNERSEGCGSATDLVALKVKLTD